MITDIEQGRNEIYVAVKNAWDGMTLDAAKNLDAVPKIIWPNVDSEQPTDVNLPWARVTILHGDREQVTLGATGTRVFRRSGMVIVQIFTPLRKGMVLSDHLSTVLEDAFDGVQTANGIWFRDVKTNEIGPEKWQQVNVIMEFQYDSLK